MLPFKTDRTTRVIYFNALEGELFLTAYSKSFPLHNNMNVSLLHSFLNKLFCGQHNLEFICLFMFFQDNGVMSTWRMFLQGFCRAVSNVK